MNSEPQRSELDNERRQSERCLPADGTGVALGRSRTHSRGAIRRRAPRETRTEPRGCPKGDVQVDPLAGQLADNAAVLLDAYRSIAKEVA
jgi:hypothetical protein